MIRLAVAALAVAALALFGPGGARSQASEHAAVAAPAPRPPELPGAEEAKAIRLGLTRVLERALLTPDQDYRYRLILRRAVSALRLLPGPRAAELGGVLGDVAAESGGYVGPRALALFSMLDENTRYLGSHDLAGRAGDLVGADGTVYRFFPGHGFQFHPLACFAALNGAVSAGDADRAAQLAAALRARALPKGGALVWEYYFPFNNGRPPWRSGMVQAVAAQAFSRAARLTGDAELLAVAGAAYRALAAGLVERPPAGPWVRLYSFDSALVLNAQLQAAISLADYASESGNTTASVLATRLESTAKTMLPSFDTGFWSLYSLGGHEAPLGYHEYVVSLLRRLAGQNDDPVWASAADRFRRYTTEPPVLHVGPPPPPIYPRPADGYRDRARVGFWLSKASTVTLHAGGAPVVAVFPHGYHELVWAPGPDLRRGSYAASITAAGLAGGRAEVVLAPLVVKRENGPPHVEAFLDGRVLTWRARDAGTPWLALRVRLRAGPATAVLRLGKRPLKGWLRLRVPPGRWGASLLASNSAGWTAEVRLGELAGSGAS